MHLCGLLPWNPAWPSRFPAARLLVATSQAILAVMLFAAALPAEEPLAPNVWVDAQAEYQLPPEIADAGWSRSDGYCGSTYRAVDGTILFRSGVQSKSRALNPGFYSNATLAWNLATNKIRVVEIAGWDGGSYGGGKLHADFAKRPTPTPRHTYDGLTWVAGEDAMYVMLGANWRITARNSDEQAKAQHELDNRSTWKYLFKEDRWERIDHSVRKFWPGGNLSPYESHLQHWPAGNRLLFLNDRARYYAEFDLPTQTWEQQATKNACPMSLYNARSTWDSQRNLWVFRLGPQL